MWLGCAVGTAAETQDPRPASYVRDVRPILQARCQGCHQPAKAEGGYVMTDVPRMLAAGDSGSAGIVPAKPDESHLLDQITIGPDGTAEMPKDGKPLAEAEIALLRRWIAEGARDDTPASAGQVVDAEHPPVYTRQPVVTSIDFSPDGRLLAVAGFHETLVFDLANVAASGVPTLRTRLVGLSERIERVRFSPDGTRLAATGGNPARMGEVQIWSVADGTLLRSAPVTFDTVYGGAWSPDGRLVAFGCADNTLRVIDAESGLQVLHQGAHEDWVLDTVFSPRGDHLVSVGRDMTAKLTEVATQRFIDNITSITPGALRGGLAAVDRHPKLEHIVAAGADGTPRVYRIHRHSKRVIGDDANQIFPLFPLNGRVFGVRFSPDGRRVASVGGLDGRGELVICSYGLEEDVPKEILGIMARVPGSGGQRKGNERKPEQVEQLKKFREASISLLARVELPSATAYAVAFRPNTTEVAVAGGDGVVRFFDSETGAAGRSFAVAPTDGAGTTGTSLPLPWPPEPSGEPEKPIAAVVQSLLVEPREIVLAGPFAAVQVVATGRLRDGSTADLTRLVTIGAEPGASDATSLVSIGSGGLLRPLSDGAGRLRVALGATAVTVPVRVEGLASSPHVDFIRDVNPVLTRMGCNQGTCHGAAKGKNGFKLSLRGYDPVFDLRALTEDHGSRRTSLASPDDSLMLLKASAAVPHVGGLLAKPADPNYHVIRRWIEQGGTLDQATPRVARLVVTPAAAVADLPGRRQQFRVVAEYADGASRDVTRQAFLESGNTDVATADPTGLVTAVRRGEAPILVRYDGAYAAVTFTVMGDREGFRWRQPEAWGTVDELVAAKWRALKIEPAPLCSDDEFLRRATLDLTGLPPTAADVRAFLADGRDPRTKRAELVRRLIGSEAFVEHWTNKWSDLLQVNPKFLGTEGAAALRGWIRSQVAANTPYDRFAREILTAAGSTREHPAASYFKVLRDPLATMENTTHLFLGVRFNCNKCHDHPFERWTQDQYYEMAAFFAQVSLGRDPASGNRTIGGTAVEDAKPLHEIVSDASEGEVKHERTGRAVPPGFPFESPHEPPASPATRRQQFAAWLTAAGNPYFARSHVNRMWGYLFGTGIIDPIDDIRAGNPPTNPPLLEHLTSRFVAGGFDTRRVLEEICTSRTYGLSIAGNRWNEDDRANYSHALPRRLPAETLFDALHAVVGSPTRFPGYPAGTRAASLPDVASTLGGGFLQTFGRPVRESACECERSGGVALGPVMALVSGPAVGDVLADRTSDLAKLVAAEPDDARLVDEVFLRVLNRPSRPPEVAAATRTMAEIGQDHETLTAELDRAESAWRSRRDALERERIERLAEARHELAAATLAAAPRLAEASRSRAEAFSSAMTAIEARLGDPGAVAREFAAQAASAPRWSVISIDPPSEKDAYMVLQDGSLFLSGTAAIGTLVLQATAPAGRLTGLRLETIPDPRMPGGGAGRGKDGAFMLTEAFLRVAPVSSPVNSTRLSFARALADHSQKGSDVALAIDDDLSNTERGWAVGPLHAEPHWAVFEVREAVTYDEPVRLTIQLDQRRNGGLAGLGRFRLSVTDSPAPLALGVPARGVELLDRSAERRTADATSELQALAAAHDSSRSKARTKLGESLAPIPPDPEVTARAADVAAAEEPLADDPAVVRLRSDVAASAAQVGDRRLTAIQDLAWALINSPAFFFNH